ncbi:MAG: Holliday junction branch migration protein RuvA [bacterium]
MIDFIKGRVVSKSPTYVVIEGESIGYGFVVSLNTFSSLPDEGKEARLFSHTIIKDEKIQLFGFISEKERGLFLTLISISGIGPKIALRILSEITPDNLGKIIQSGNVSSLSRIKGIGEKTAKRIILELSNKLPEKEDKDLEDSCIQALISLGYSKREASLACKRALLKNPKDLEELIKEALK